MIFNPYNEQIGDKNPALRQKDKRAFLDRSKKS
jgi:hypothetical protein